MRDPSITRFGQIVMPFGDRAARFIAAQLTIAVAFVVLFRLQMMLPDLPGTAIATIFFLPAVVRTFATLYCGPAAFFGLFAGSLIIALPATPFQENALWHGLSSAGSAPLIYWIFAKLGLLPQRPPGLRVDAMVFLPFVLSYAVTNAGLHLIGLSILTTAISPHLPYFLTMVTGDLIPPLLGFGLFWAFRHVFASGTPPKH